MLVLDWRLESFIEGLLGRYVLFTDYVLNYTNSFAERHGGNHPLTIALLAFKNMDGFDTLHYITDHLYEDYEALKNEPSETDSLQDYRLGGLKLILQFYTNII